MRVLGMSRQNGRVFRNLMLGSALVGAIAMGSAADARAEGIVDSVLSTFGLGGGKDESIVYRERSPLVIPPKRSLPAPERGVAETNPAWPVDPEIKARKETAEASGITSNLMDEQARPLRPDQLTPGRKYGKSVRIQRPTGVTDPDGNESARPLRPSEMGSKTGMFGMFKSDDNQNIGRFVSEPPRANLTEPPAGYQTPSPNSPYGLGKDNTPIKPYDYHERHGTD
jgi:hypothetical protein